MGCGMGVIKCLFFFFNFIFVLCGLAMLVMGVLMQIGNAYSENLDDDISKLTLQTSITFIVIGSIIFFIAFLGCCGAIRESHCMIVTFASLLLTILIIQVAVAIYVFVTVRNSGEISFKDAYTINLFNKYKNGGEEKEYVDAIQEGFKCCGVDGPDDFDLLYISIPGTCCGKSANDTCDQMHSYKTGCADAMIDFFKKILYIVGGMILGIAVGIELIGITFAVCLANSIKNAERSGHVV